jgi:cytochrome c-type biogenesis protein CcmH
MKAAILAVGVALSLASVAPAPAQSPGAVDTALEAATARVASQLRCPVCQGLSIQDSPTELAREMKDVVRDQLAAGRTPEEVKAYFVSKYGEWILLEPQPHGFNLAVYLLPIAALLGGGGVVAVAVRRWTRQGSPTDDQPMEEV